MIRRILPAMLALSAVFSTAATARARTTLDIYFLDMAGGGSNLIVTPLGESILIDTGSLEPEHRDADRILAACRDAGIDRIDHLITTHFHLDHFGAILEVSMRIPIKRFYDKGLPPEHEQKTKWFQRLYPLYRRATKGEITTIKAGDDIGLRDRPDDVYPPVTLHCFAADKKIEGFSGDIDAPVPGFDIGPEDRSDNARSIALMLRYGDFDCYLGGDITLNVEHHLVHPRNRIGKIDIYQVTHHGLDQSNNPLLLGALEPTVAIAMNGRRKGVQPRTFETLTSLPSLEALYQIHYNTQYGDSGNTAAQFIANAKNSDGGNYIKASVNSRSGTYRIRIKPDGPTRTYRTKSARTVHNRERFMNSVRTELNENIFDFWLTHTIDNEHGGFIGRMTNDNRRIENAPKGLILNARILWTFAAAYRCEKNPEYLKAANRAYDYLTGKFHDPEHGGYYWLLDHKGAPVDLSKELYAQSFVIYALAEYHLATGKAEPLEKAKALFRLLETKCHDDENAGYFETFFRDWRQAPQARLAFEVEKAQKTMNTHLHVLEAWTNLYRAWKDPLLKRRLAEMIEIFRDRIINPDTHHFELFFDAHWKSLKQVVSFGHDIEGSWLLAEAAEVLGDERLLHEIEPICVKMADACLKEGLDTNGALFYEAEHGRITIPAKHWWAQAETAVGFCNAYQLSGDRKFLRAARKNWRFIKKHQVNHEHGEWYGVAPTPEKPADPNAMKVSEWKAPYHNARACLELIRRLQSF